MILYDIPTPKSCKDCPCYDDHRYKCKVTGSMATGRNSAKTERLRDCPIIDFEERDRKNEK